MKMPQSGCRICKIIMLTLIVLEPLHLTSQSFVNCEVELILLLDLLQSHIGDLIVLKPNSLQIRELVSILSQCLQSHVGDLIVSKINLLQIRELVSILSQRLQSHVGDLIVRKPNLLQIRE